MRCESYGRRTGCVGLWMKLRVSDSRKSQLAASKGRRSARQPAVAERNGALTVTLDLDRRCCYVRSGLCALRRLRTARPAPRLFRYLGCEPPSGSLCHLRAQHARCRIHCPDHHLLLSLPRAIHVVCKQSLSCSLPSPYSLRERASCTLYCSNHHRDQLQS